jgi:hypothetical protein
LKLLLHILFLLIAFSSNAKIPELVKVIKEKPLKVFLNYSDEVFLLEKGIIKKYNSEGVLMTTYGNIYIDQQTQVISNNTFKTLLFCPDYGKIIQLDKRLGEIDVIDIFKIGNYVITAAAPSYDNEFLWIWDMSTQRLIKLNNQQEPVFTSNTISLATGTEIYPNSLQEIATHLIINDTARGIFLFDNNGNYQKQLPVKNALNVKMKSEVIYYIKNDILFSYDLKTFTETQYAGAPLLQHMEIGQTILCGINPAGFVEIWQY